MTDTRSGPDASQCIHRFDMRFGQQKRDRRKNRADSRPGRIPCNRLREPESRRHVSEWHSRPEVDAASCARESRPS